MNCPYCNKIMAESMEFMVIPNVPFYSTWVCEDCKLRIGKDGRFFTISKIDGQAYFQPTGTLLIIREQSEV